MARMVVVAVSLAAVIVLASPFPSHAGFRSRFVTAFPVAIFARPAFVPFASNVVVVSPSFVSLSSFSVPVRRVFVREVIVPETPFVVFPGPRLIVISQPVFVAPVQPIFVAKGCFFDQFNVLRCVR